MKKNRVERKRRNESILNIGQDVKEAGTTMEKKSAKVSRESLLDTDLGRVDESMEVRDTESHRT